MSVLTAFDDSVSLPVRYSPRSRPFLPICPALHPFFSTVKVAPGEWHQVSSTMSSRDQRVDPIDCHLFIPSVQIYAISDTIPIHLQLRGSLKSLCTFMSPLPSVSSSFPKLGLGLRSSRSSSMTTASSSSFSSPSMLHAPPRLRNPYARSVFGTVPRASLDASQPSVRVFILRQVTAKVNYQKAWRSTVIGEGTLWPMQQNRTLGAGMDDSLEALDWEGEVRCNSDVTTGSFVAGDFVVKDFMVVHLCPPNPESSPLLEHQHAHPIRLVTDPYLEAYDYPTSDA